MLKPEFSLEELMQLIGCDAVGNDSSSRIILRRESRSKSYYLITRYRYASRTDCSRSVSVSVKDYSEIGVIVFDSLADGSHGLRVLRIGRMIRESAVRIEIEAAAYVGAHFFEDFRRKESRGSVARIYHYVHALQISRHVLQSLRYHLAQV